MTWWLLLAAGWIVAAVWILTAVPAMGFLRRGDLEDRASQEPELARWPSVSVVIPARDEEARIEQALLSVAELDYPRLEVIAVDDRSRDATGEIMDRLAGERAGIQVVHIDTLPEGWIGKCHAMHAGASRASGELLLFTDGDVIFDPGTLREAVRLMEGRRLDHLALLPGIIPGGYWEDALKCYFALVFIMGTRAWAASSSSRMSYVGVGAFNLVRREAYDGIGGHESLRLEVVDDLMLGKRIKQMGYAQDALLAPRHMRLSWHEGVAGVVRGLEKNSFAALDYSVPLLLAVTFMIAILYAAPYLGALFLRDERVIGYAATLVLMHAAFGLAASARPRGWLLAPALPVVALVYLGALWRSAYVTLRQGGVRWRETFYPLQALKRGRRR